MNLSKKDIFWGYFAQFFNLGAGIIILPAILHILSPEEVGLNYLMLTVSSLVALFDFGFAPQFGRNITYVLNGAQSLQKEGIDGPLLTEKKAEINYHLLANMIQTAKSVYRRLAFIVLFFMLTFGLWYIYEVTNGFHTIDNVIIVWVIFSFSIYFNIYYTYYASLLTGSAKIKEAQEAVVYSKIVYILLILILLKLHAGLFGVVIANLVSPFVNRYLSYYWFFTKDYNEKLKGYSITTKEEYDLFLVIWHNAKKLGLVFIGSYSINKLSLFLAGLFLPLSLIGSYGLMIQLLAVVNTLAGTLFGINQPIFASLRVKNETELFLKKFSFNMNVYYLLFMLGSTFLLLFGSPVLELIHSKTVLPPAGIMILYVFILLLEGNHSSFATIIVINNNVPFVKASLISGGLIALGSYLSLAYTSTGILGLILVQGIVQLGYNNWKWPYCVCSNFNISFFRFLILGMNESIVKIKYLYGRL